MCPAPPAGPFTVSALLGYVAGVAGLAWAEAVPSWLVWWLGDTAGLLIIAPPLMTAAIPRLDRTAPRTVGWLLVTAALSALAFTNAITAPARELLVFLPFMMLIWVG